MDSRWWATPLPELLQSLGSSVTGLTSAEAQARLERTSSLRIDQHRTPTILALLLRQLRDPIVMILLAATVVAMVLGDTIDSMIILVIIAASAVLSAWQEHNAGRAVDALLDQVRVEAEVLRDGVAVPVPIDEVVPGDVVLLNGGDLIPGDGRVMTSNELTIDESPLTGESFPAEKTPGIVPADASLTERTNSLLLGSHVLSGEGAMVITRIGSETAYGTISTALRANPEPTSFEQGIRQFGYLLVRATTVLVIVVFLVNILLNRPLFDAFLFSVALAVGLTPQMLPAIVAISLSHGASQMAAEKVVVKRLNVIEDLGEMTTLCTDKTGTLTDGKVAFADALDCRGTPDEQVGRLAWINAKFQTGYDNPIDRALIASLDCEDGGVLFLDENPYDFQRRCLSVLVEDHGDRVMVTKGAVEPMLERCSDLRDGRTTIAFAPPAREMLVEQFQTWSDAGYRVLAIASKALPNAGSVRPEDETGMVLEGFLRFTERPKSGVVDAIDELAALGVSTRMITGDNRFAARHAARDVGLPVDQIITGRDLDTWTDAEIEARIADVAVFAEIAPEQKEQIVRLLKQAGEVVGFLGDGINDAPALHRADVGISVDTAVDVAKQAAAVVLLEADLAVMVDGVRLGRETFANTLKYINVTTSANFGNMLSMAVASAVLPFLPLLPRQILLLNFLSDLPGMTIARDRVDPEQVEQPQTWSIRSIRSFMLLFGSISSVFDLLTFATLRIGFNAGPALFRSGWFVVSVMTELAVMLVLRTRRPFFRSLPGRALLVSSVITGFVAIAIPFSPLAGPMGFEALPVRMVFAAAGIIAGYVLVTEIAKDRWNSTSLT